MTTTQTPSEAKVEISRMQAQANSEIIKFLMIAIERPEHYATCMEQVKIGEKIVSDLEEIKQKL